MRPIVLLLGDEDQRLEQALHLAGLACIRARSLEELGALAGEHQPELIVTARKPPSDDTGDTRRELMSWLAHEVKDPLSAAMMNADLLLNHNADAFTVGQLVMLKRQLRRIDELVMSLLDASRLDEGRIVLQRERVHVHDWLTPIVERWRDAHPEHTFGLHCAGALYVELDGERARQIVDNLISNAVKYGGRDRRVDIEVSRVGSDIEIHVRDSGAGIELADQARIFERFEQVGDSRGSHGLGLYISATLARLHHGSLRVESRAGEGSTFVLALPSSDTSREV